MYKLCKTEQSAKRQREIEVALFEMMKTARYEDITITAICERMKMPRKAFYRYFDGKDDALFAFIEHSLADYSGFSVDYSAERSRSLAVELEEYFKFWQEKREVLIALDRSGLIGTLIEQVMNYSISQRIATAKFLPNESDEMRERIFRFALAGLVCMMIEWYKGGFKKSARDMASYACRMFVDPLFPSLKEIGFDA